MIVSGDPRPCRGWPISAFGGGTRGASSLWGCDAKIALRVDRDSLAAHTNVRSLSHPCLRPLLPHITGLMQPYMLTIPEGIRSMRIPTPPPRISSPPLPDWCKNAGFPRSTCTDSLLKQSPSAPRRDASDESSNCGKPVCATKGTRTESSQLLDSRCGSHPRRTVLSCRRGCRANLR